MADRTPALKLFGFEITRSKKDKEAVTPLPNASVVPPTDDDGAGYVTSPAFHYGMHLDIYADLQVKDNADLIRKYRAMATQPEVDMAIEEIVNEAIVNPQYDEFNIIDVNVDRIKVSESIKKKVKEEFDYLLKLMSFNERAQEMFRNWYIDGRIYHHLVVDAKNLKQGIKEIRHIDSLKMRKVKHVKKSDERQDGVKLVKKVEEFYIYTDKSPDNCGPQTPVYGGDMKGNAVKLSNDSVSYVTSGLLDERRQKVISHLHKAMRPINQLRMMEDSLIIYRLARAPERRIFYVDVGNLPKGKAEAYINTLMSRYRNKLVYDNTTGELKDQRKHMSMLDDFWLPRREGGRGTEVSTLPGGSNLGEIDDIKYFQRKVYQALNVPVSRLEQEQAYSLGRATEITREEIKFQKFITRLRLRFSKLFTGILRQQLILKGIITDADWVEYFHNNIRIEYYKDNHYTELKDQEVMRERLNLMDQCAQYVGEYISKDWVMRTIFKFDEKERAAMKREIDKEVDSGEVDPDKFNPLAKDDGGDQPAPQPMPQNEPNDSDE